MLATAVASSDRAEGSGVAVRHAERRPVRRRRARPSRDTYAVLCNRRVTHRPTGARPWSACRAPARWAAAGWYALTRDNGSSHVLLPMLVSRGDRSIVEQDHRRIKRLVRAGLGCGIFWTARRTLAGCEAMAMIRKGQVRRRRHQGTGCLHRGANRSCPPDRTCRLHLSGCSTINAKRCNRTRRVAYDLERAAERPWWWSTRPDPGKGQRHPH